MPVTLKTSLEESTTSSKAFLFINLSQSRKHEKFQLTQNIPWHPFSKWEALSGMSYERATDSERANKGCLCWEHRADKCSSFGVRRDIATHASPTARNVLPVLISAFLVIHLPLIQILPTPFISCLHRLASGSSSHNISLTTFLLSKRDTIFVSVFSTAIRILCWKKRYNICLCGQYSISNTLLDKEIRYLSL